MTSEREQATHCGLVALGDVDAARCAASSFGQDTVSTPSRSTAEISSASIGSGSSNRRANSPWPRSRRWYCSHEPGPLAPHAGQRDAVIGGLDGDVGLEDARQFGGEDVRLGGLVQVDRWLPAGRPGRETVQALLDGEQVAQRIPAGKRHRSAS